MAEIFCAADQNVCKQNTQCKCRGKYLLLPVRECSAEVDKANFSTFPGLIMMFYKKLNIC